MLSTAVMLVFLSGVGGCGDASLLFPWTRLRSSSRVRQLQQVPQQRLLVTTASRISPLIPYMQTVFHIFYINISMLLSNSRAAIASEIRISDHRAFTVTATLLVPSATHHVHSMRPTANDGPVAWRVSLCVEQLRCAKSTERIEVLFGLKIPGNPGTM